jgi:LmbE family N-acetylglucosaminyl deacetylase
MASDQLTLMAVHAHPDDESSSTGGVLAKYAAEGVRTVVVTCTNGELGDGPGGVKPGEPGHDTEGVAATRLDELRTACDLLGVAEIELLGYHDSGMADWHYKDDERAFSAVPVDAAADRLAALMEIHRPDVVTTYCIDDGYDHPDHLHAHHVTLAAVARTGIPRKVYLSCIRASAFDRVMSSLRELGVDMSEFEGDDGAWREKLAAAERRITTTVDVSAYVGRKREALAAHASQISESFFAKLPEHVFAEAFGQESFIKVHDATDSPVPETDLLAGL